MDINQERKIIRETLEMLLKHQPSYGNAKYEPVFDSEHDRYQILLTGWTDLKRSFSIVAQIDIRDGLIWLQQDNTDMILADYLIEAGIPRERIVLGFQAPYKRGLHGFGTGEMK